MAHSRGLAPSAPIKVYFLEGVVRGARPPGRKLADYLQDSTPRLDCVGAKSPPITDTERGAGCKEIPERSVERRIPVTGTSVIHNGLSAVQYNGQVGKILHRCAAATQERIPVALITRKKLSMKPANLKVDDAAMLNDSMPPFPLPQATDDALSDESRPPLNFMRVKPVGANEDEEAVPKIDAASGRTIATRHPATKKQKIHGWRTTSTFNELLATGDRRGIRGRWQGDPVAERRVTQLRRRHQSESQKSTQERVLVALMSGHRLSVNSAKLEIAPTAQSSSLSNTTHWEHHRGGEAENHMRKNHHPGDNPAGGR